MRDKKLLSPRVPRYPIICIREALMRGRRCAGPFPGAFVSTPSRRRGMALPMVIVVLLVLAASLAGGVALMRGERALDDAGIRGAQAQALAETGLHRLVGDRAALGLNTMPSDSTVDSLRVVADSAAGYVNYYWVVTEPLRRNTGTVPGLWLLRSRGVVGRRSIAEAPAAEYTVTQLATWVAGSMKVKAAFAGANGMDKTGASGNISGVDQCSAEPSVPGVVVPSTSATGGAGFTGSSAAISGSPNIATIGANPEALANSLPYDWANIYSGTALPPTFTSTSSGTGFPTQDWFDSHPTEYPIILVTGGAFSSFTLNVTGRGLLIVQGDLDLNGNSAGWEGVLLVGGKLTSHGNNQVIGATVAGLNAQTGGFPGPSSLDVLNGNKDFLYNSCSVKKALQKASHLRPYPNTWSNNYTTY